MFHADYSFGLSTMNVGMAFFVALITYAAVFTHYSSPHQAVFLLPLMQDISRSSAFSLLSFIFYPLLNPF